MTWLTNILAIYLLTLSLWPCADEPLSIMDRGSHTVLMSAGAPKPDASHHHHDQCTPFCVCACCAATIAMAPYFSYSLFPSVAFTPIREAAEFPYAPISWADPLSAIWQPPKHRA